MAKIINLDEKRIRRSIAKAEEYLCTVRTLISHGDYNRLEEALELESLIFALEDDLIRLIETDMVLPLSEDSYARDD